MPKSYRIYFRNACGAIEACENFRAPDTASAQVIAASLFAACSDCCAEYDLWCGKERVDDAAQPNSMPLTPRMEESLLQAAEALHMSRWKIAESAGLPGLLAQLRDSGARRPLFIQFQRMIAQE